VKLATFNRIKRVVDVVVVVATSWVTLPVGAATAFIVRRRLGSPVFFTQTRVGLNDQEFDVVKFRTMTDERDETGRLMSDAHRLTRLGRVLRATSLDEIPQLLNVLRGDMSLVGPRPLFPRYLPHYSALERQRHSVRPGITGLAQVSGRNSVAWDERLGYDIEYVRRASLFADLRIVYRTLRQVISRQDVSVLASDSGEPLDVARSYPSRGDVRLRRLRSSDLETRVSWIARSETRRHMQWPENLTLESTRQWFHAATRDPSRIDLAAERGGVVVAMAGLRKTGPRSAEFYVFVDPSRHGEGLGRSVTGLTLNYAWQTLDLDAVTLTVARENKSAVRIYDAIGFSVTSETADRVTMELMRP
jgi:lipopolysaccharide/colanic/teichoic acid biosynthesis glycosyltransferase/RimJ/RimL family protein N-acetyltransferase